LALPVHLLGTSVAVFAGMAFMGREQFLWIDQNAVSGSYEA